MQSGTSTTVSPATNPYVQGYQFNAQGPVNVPSAPAPAPTTQGLAVGQTMPMGGGMVTKIAGPSSVSPQNLPVTQPGLPTQAPVTPLPIGTKGTPTNLYQYFTQGGQALPSLASRAQQYEQAGLGKASTYTGTTEQNNALLQSLLKSAPVKTPSPAVITSKPAETAVTAATTGINQVTNIPRGQIAPPTDYASRLQGIEGAQESAFSNLSNQLSQLNQGQVPYTQFEVDSLNALKATLDSAHYAQVIANANAQRGSELLRATTGAGEFAPVRGMSMVQQTIQSGIRELSNLDNQAAKTMADAKQAIYQNHYKQIVDSYNALQTVLDKRAGLIKDMQAQSNWLQDFTQKANEFNQTQALEREKFALQLKQGGYKLDNNGQIVFDTAGANAGTVTPGQTGIPLLDSNTKTTTSGVPYVDGTNLTGAEAATMQRQAANLGIPYLGKDQADAQANIETAKTNMQNIQGTLKGILPTSALGRFIDFSGQGRTMLGNTLSSLFQTNDQIASFNAYRSAAIQALRAMAGSKGLRINQAEILQSVNQDIPKITDTVATAQAKIAKVNSMLNSQEKGIYGSKIYDTYNADAAKQDMQQYYNASPDHAKQIDTLIQTYPGLTDSQIMQLVQP